MASELPWLKKKVYHELGWNSYLATIITQFLHEYTFVNWCIKLILQIQVIEDDKRNKGGLFQTGQRGGVPPLVTTNFIAEDLGNQSSSLSLFCVEIEFCFK